MEMTKLLSYGECVVPGCSITRKDNNLMKHKFPKEKIISYMWMLAVRNPEIIKLNEKQLRQRFVCERHFTEDSYHTFVRIRKLLKKTAVPQLFLPEQQQPLGLSPTSFLENYNPSLDRQENSQLNSILEMTDPILTCIEDEHISNPLELFEIWFEEAKTHSASHFDSLCLSTVSRDGGVNARYVKLRKFDGEGFIIVTDKRGEKAQEIAENNKGSMVFLFSYKKDNIVQNRQVRIRGHLISLPTNDILPIYNAEPHFCKVRANIVPQGSIVSDWNILRKICETVSLKERKEGLPMPIHFIGYKMIPEIMDFYHGPDGIIADRLVYKKDFETNIWSKERIGV